MCASCLSNAEFVLTNVALVGALVKATVHRALADLGVVAPPDPVAHDVRTVAFLRSLDLDPVALLGAEAVEAAAAWAPAPASYGFGLGRRSRRPIGSHSLAITK